MSSDLVNAVFEWCGALPIVLSIVAVYQAGHVAGVSPWHMLYFVLWGIWNCWYYPSLKQWKSFYGASIVLAANLVYFGMLLYYA